MGRLNGDEILHSSDSGGRRRSYRENRNDTHLSIRILGAWETEMRTCRLCRWPVTLDDVVLALGEDRCICLPCYLRATGTVRPMPADYRRQIDEALAAAAI